MIFKLFDFKIVTRSHCEMINITEQVRKCVEEAGVKNGFLHVMSKHTTVSVVVNEGFPCVEEDIVRHLEKLAPEDGDYIHNHYLPSDGCIAYNAPAHLKSILTGYFAYALIEEKVLKIGSRMEFYLVELDGPKTRGYTIQVCGEQ